MLAATFVTNLGDGLRLAAFPLLATTLTSSPLLVGGLTAAQFLPWTTFAPFGGVIVDRSDRRRLILITQAWRAAVMALLALAIVADVAQIWHLFVVVYLITAGEILVDPSVVATLPTLVRPADLDRANGRLTTVETITNDFAGGPVGAVTFAIAPWLPFLIDAVSYSGSIVPFSRLPRRRIGTSADNQPGHETGGQPVQRVAMGDGLRWIKEHPFLRRLTVGVAIFHVGTAGALALMVLLVTQVLGAVDIVFGLVLAAAALGATAASLVAARLVEAFSRRRVMTSAALLAAITVFAASAATEPWQLVAIWVVNGAASGMMLAIGRGFIQRHTPNDRLGRTAVASRTITRTAFVVGALLAGGVADVVSVRWSFVVAGSFHLVGAALVWRSFEYESAEPTALS